MPDKYYAGDEASGTGAHQPAPSAAAESIRTTDDREDKFRGNREQHYIQSAARTLYHQRQNDDDTINSNVSLYDTEVVYHWIHGRRYCKDYFMPNDEVEQTRLQMLGEVYYEVLGCRLTTVPLHNPTKILDVGTGTGEWAMAMGDEYPEAEIIGTDIARIQPTAIPLNVFFEIDDAEEESGWTWPENDFDLVHYRYMKGAFKDWKQVYLESYKHLKPGGWIEILDFDDQHSLMEFVPKDHRAHRWMREVMEASLLHGHPRTTQHLEPESLEEVGFVDVQAKLYDIPLGAWHNDPEMQVIGKHFLIAILSGMEPISLRLLTEQMGWGIEELRDVVEDIGSMTMSLATNHEKAQGLRMELRVLIGRKPFPDEVMDEEGSRTPTNGESA